MTLAMSVLLSGGCTGKAVLKEPGWEPRVREALEALISDYGKSSGNYDPKCRPYAVFDFDNTTIINDIAQTLLVYQIENRAFDIEPEEMFGVLTASIPDLDADYGNGTTPRSLATDLSRDYAELCTFEDIGAMRSSDAYRDFRAKLWYLSSNPDTSYPDSPFGCIWITTLLDGMTPGEVASVTRSSVDSWMEEEAMWRETWSSPDGSVSVEIPKGLAFTPEMRELYRALGKAGFDVYICSASYEGIVEAVACDEAYGLGVPEENVFGIRLEPTADSTLKAVGAEGYPQPYRKGKVDCIKEYMASAHCGRGPALVAGDSNGDYAMLTSFPDLKVGLIVNCLRSGGIGSQAKAAAEDTSAVDLAHRDAPLYVVQGRDPGSLRFIPEAQSRPVELVEGR